ncbi:hypothetical protein VMCG_09474 [Cytospora schulzeri]|uniref:Uncharacterized protein n=1 Tax=Cytospora schulzeri TaxID=448051 RepID=A0A423VKV2_9PEZI|nr:hypothetical protein VMCG_09474 [Valsa malicola]
MGPWIAIFFAIGLVDYGHTASVEQFTTDDWLTDPSSGNASISDDLGWFGGGEHIDIVENTKAIKTHRISDIWYAFENTTACHQDDGVDENRNIGVLNNGCHHVDNFVPGRRIECVRLDSNSLI